ncbi:MAG: release factor glutamine methyltransferase [Sphingomonadales bacterium]|nr:release factor glutamine methyltransferase [Sphingomonadales bacterium]
MRSLFVTQHILPSSIGFIRRIREAFSPLGFFLFGKAYSTIPSAAREASRLGLSVLDQNERSHIGQLSASSGEVIIMDEGGGLHDRFPVRDDVLAVGVEQTTAGNRVNWKYPTVLVCRSAAKLEFEAQIIARGILRKLEALGLLASRPNIGVLGLGALGGELARRLAERGFAVSGYDPKPVNGPLGSLRRPREEVVASSSLILGVTGRDCLAGMSPPSAKGQKVLVSCSSSDVEFASMRPFLRPAGGYEVLSGAFGSADVTLMNGGFPINFDRETEWETPDEIWLTRSLCFEGLLQARSLIGSRPRGVMLDPQVQAALVGQWLDRLPDAADLRVPQALDPAYFRRKSEGECEMNDKPVYTLHETTPGALDQMRAHKEPYEVDVAGRSILVLPGVWSPKYDWSSLFYVEHFPDVSGRSFLEIGSGTGVISVFAGLRGASSVVAVDVNPEAVRNSQLNFERHRLSDAQAFQSEGFAAVRGRFDVITWNAPYHGSRPDDLLERGCADEDYRGIRAFFREVRDYLSPHGTIVFGFSESGDLPLIRALIAAAGFRIHRELSDWRQEYNCMLLELTAVEGWDQNEPDMKGQIES